MKYPFLALVPLLLASASTGGSHAMDGEVPLAVADGFTVQLVADDSLVHDAFSMTIDAKGRPIVSGPRYIRTLFDRDNNGVFESSELWHSSIQEGAQGLWYEDGQLYWVADKALWTARDSNGDGKADTQPTRLFSLPTGGEHDAHAIRRGPDGYWYLMVGNFANGIVALKNDPQSPVDRPRAGTLWRISPDFQRKGVWAHGLRNAYDFDFLPGGEIVTYDSDDERAATLPWYRPTRVFVLSPGSDSGWVGQGWKDSNVQLTMPRTIAQLGRGSPTGVVVYRHKAFPEKYHNAVFALDWTFGRVVAIFPSSGLDAKDTRGRINTETEIFLQPEGSAGFAPTDICIEPSGNLLISVGGRGTRGAIYRVSPVEKRPLPSVLIFESTVSGTTPKSSDRIRLTEPQERDLASIASSPCPLESWSSSQWIPKARRLSASLLSAIAGGRAISVKDQPLNDSARVAAIYALVRLQLPMNEQDIEGCLSDASPSVRVAAWFALPRLPSSNVSNASFARFRSGLIKDNANFESGWGAVLGDVELRNKLECCGLLQWSISDLLPATRSSSSVRSLEQQLTLRQLAFWAHSRSKVSPADAGYEKLAADALYNPPNALNVQLLTSIVEFLNPQSKRDPALLLEVFAAIQAAVGKPRWNVEPQQDTKAPSAFDGYRSLYGARFGATSPDWVKWFASELKRADGLGWSEVVTEGMRTVAMLEPDSDEILSFSLSRIDESSHPTSDIHALLLLAQCRGARTSRQTELTAQALLGLGEKVRRAGVNTDNNWAPRLSELIRVMIDRDPMLVDALLKDPSFGSADHLIWAEQFPAAQKSEAKSRFATRIVELPLQQCSPTLLRFVSSSVNDVPWRNFLRQAAKDSTLRSVAVELLAQSPAIEDYDCFLEALAGADRSSWSFAWRGLEAIPINNPKRELCCLALLLARSKTKTEGLELRAILQRLEKVVARLDIPTPPNSTDWKLLGSYFKEHLPEEVWDVVCKIRDPNQSWGDLVERSNALKGDPSRGRLLFSQAKCEQCHQGQSSLGPSLAGVAKRFSKEDLFLAIYEPSQDISDRYRAHQIVTTEGNVVVGLIVYDSPDRLMLLTNDGTQISFNQSDIETRKVSEQSIMPDGLLDTFTAQQIADLYAFLQNIQ